MASPSNPGNALADAMNQIKLGAAHRVRKAQTGANTSWKGKKVMTAARSPLAPDRFPALPPIGGLTLTGVEAGLRYRGRPDLMLARLDPCAAMAGVFSRSSTRSPAVDWSAANVANWNEHGETSGPAAIIANAGNANAFTGQAGRATTQEMAEIAARVVGTSTSRVFVASTGVIGEPLEIGPIRRGAETAAEGMSPRGWKEAADAIRTTDTFPKGAAAPYRIGELRGHVAGIAKGSGMIAPNMGTMLAFAFTDASISQGALQQLLTETTETTFNAITVDGDSSTSDTLLLAATGTLGNAQIEGPSSPGYDAVRAAIHETLLALAHQVVRDGEGASKFATIRVAGALDVADARRAAESVANSPLVKTALAGEDPNWGRIVMAIGKSGAALDVSALGIRLGEIQVTRNGAVSPAYREQDGADYMRNAEIEIGIDLGTGGSGHFTMWTCDLTARYVSINADYRS